jgi:hypothetical protein
MANVIDVTNNQIIVEVTASEIVIDTFITEVILELSGATGPAGVPGSATIVQESEPTGGTEGDLWFNPVTLVLKIYTSGVWVDENTDDGYF